MARLCPTAACPPRVRGPFRVASLKWVASRAQSCAPRAGMGACVRPRIGLANRGGSGEKISLSVTTHEHVSFLDARLSAALARVREPRGYRDA
jgi:hypothetical protein